MRATNRPTWRVAKGSRALAGRPMRQRAAMVLGYYDDLPVQRVAEILGCSVPAARSIVLARWRRCGTIGGDET